MTKREINPLHNIAILEYRFKFFYFLRDLGIKSATHAARTTSQLYMDILTDITYGG